MCPAVCAWTLKSTGLNQQAETAAAPPHLDSIARFTKPKRPAWAYRVLPGAGLHLNPEP